MSKTLVNYNKNITIKTNKKNYLQNSSFYYKKNDKDKFETMVLNLSLFFTMKNYQPINSLTQERNLSGVSTCG